MLSNWGMGGHFRASGEAEARNHGLSEGLNRSTLEALARPCEEIRAMRDAPEVRNYIAHTERIADAANPRQGANQRRVCRLRHGGTGRSIRVNHEHSRARRKTCGPTFRG